MMTRTKIIKKKNELELDEVEVRKKNTNNYNRIKVIICVLFQQLDLFVLFFSSIN